MTIAPQSKIIFANQIQVVAVMCVMLSHFLGVYWGMRDVVSSFWCRLYRRVRILPYLCSFPFHILITGHSVLPYFSL